MTFDLSRCISCWNVVCVSPRDDNDVYVNVKNMYRRRRMSRTNIVYRGLKSYDVIRMRMTSVAVSHAVLLSPSQ